ncbi:predicted protein [Sclerotinia sclerotiorum 1980 UF-70]|uniref:Uncharacterized protein n=1 Tax=Sclerotinia sclerotiorum (strain ATCC 18683 / 1980 / Ss-1) TaxID=665079 RepID=A7ESH6_SCLS1|nr:predicted protein [Sclerotinia sclerotiorum 1980 UF-70]EDN92418.1 predicted protein [Sclerotinia sclerotiorum 1980 UF-70]
MDIFTCSSPHMSMSTALGKTERLPEYASEQDLGHGGPLILRPLKADRKQAEYGIVHCEEAKSYSSHLLTRPKCSHVV